jgi:two-component system, LytTR family, response regulator
MDRYKVILVDDNQDSLEIINYFLREDPDYQLIGLCQNGEELIENVLLNKPDLIITDINMPKKNGMQAIKECISIYPHVKFIFVSGYDEYAIEAFEVAAVDYIVKPVEKFRFHQALKKAKSLINLEHGEVEEHQSDQKINKLSIRDLTSTRFIPQTDIYFIEKVGKKCLVYTKAGIYEATQTLGKMLEQLDNHFFQGHRSFIINLQKISQITPQNETFLVSFKGYNQYASISKLKINEVKEKLTLFQEK